jgi:virginiamycin B lyase
MDCSSFHVVRVQNVKLRSNSKAPPKKPGACAARLGFGENNLSAQKIAVFDTRTKEFKEWEDRPIDPYDAILDKSGHVWTGGEPTDFVSRLDPKSGEIVNYLLPNVNTDIRRVNVDNFTNPPSMLIGENHRGKIVLVQPLE